MHSFRSSSRIDIAAGIACLAFACASPALSQTYPSKPVRIAVTLPAGNPLDVQVRLVGSKLSALWGQPVIVENKPGGNFVIGTEYVVKSPADGYTLLATITSIVQSPALMKNLPYDTVKDLAPITKIGDSRLFLVVDAKLPARTLGELLNLVRASPGKFNFASYGVATTSHLVLEKINIEGKVNVVHIPYKGSSASVQAVLSGEASLAMNSMTDVGPHIAAGKLRALAVNGERRSPYAPEVPTFEEAGLSGFNVGIWSALFAPAGTPEAILSRIAADVGRALATPEVQDLYRQMGNEPTSSTPSQFKEVVRREIEYWSDLTRRSGIKVE